MVRDSRARSYAPVARPSVEGFEDVFVQVLVSKDNQKVDEFRTKSVEIEGKMIKRLQDYFNAKDDDQGKYKFDLIVNFWNINNNVEQKEFTFEGELLSKN